MKTFFKLFAFTLLALIFVVNFAPTRVLATDCQSDKDGYCLLVPIPINGDLSNTTNKVDIGSYIKNIVTLAIGVAGALAVLRIIFGGIQYMTTEAFEGKSDARSIINDAVIGLLLVLSSYIILYTVNPKLVEFDINIKGLRAGGAISTDLGSTTPGVDTLGGNTTGSCVIDKDGNKAPCTCINCANVADSGLVFKNASAVAMNADLLRALKNVKGSFALSGIDWQVTEAWPTTSKHSDPCHYNGSCADINLTTAKYTGAAGEPTPMQVAQINNLASGLKREGLSVVIFEVNTANYNRLKAAKVNEWILVDISKDSAYVNNTAPSFHVKK